MREEGFNTATGSPRPCGRSPESSAGEQSMAPTLDDLPDTPEDLARIIQDPSASQDRKSRAMAKLAPVIEGEAEKLCRKRFPERYSEELRSRATSVLWDKLRQNKFDPERGRFTTFARMVLHHAFCDIVRREFAWEGRGGSDVERDGVRSLASAAADETDWQDDRELWDWHRRQLRAVLDRVSWKPRSKGGIHYYIVLLLALRKGMCALVADWSDAGDGKDCKLSDFIQWLLQWHAWESESRFAESLAQLGTVWTALRAKVEHPPHCLESPDIADAIGKNSSPEVTISPSRWNQWAKRAKQEARKRINDTEWNALFARLLPDRPRSPSLPRS